MSVIECKWRRYAINPRKNEGPQRRRALKPPGGTGKRIRATSSKETVKTDRASCCSPSEQRSKVATTSQPLTINVIVTMVAWACRSRRLMLTIRSMSVTAMFQQLCEGFGAVDVRPRGGGGRNATSTC